MQAIVSLKVDGKWAEVGMNNRTVIGPYRRMTTIREKARNYARGAAHRIEYFGDAPGALLGNPVKVEIIDA